VAKYLLLNGTESWRLQDHTDLVQFQADLRAAMEDGRVIDAYVADGSDSQFREILINGANLVTAVITERDMTGSFGGAVVRERLVDR
jgi:hypothetical protein